MNHKVCFQHYFNKKSFLSLFSMLLMTTIFLSTSLATFAQAKLSLADILIALRSKKATVEKKNEILTEAVKTRGITFAITPEIEKELQDNGANANLVAAVKEIGGVKTAPKIPERVEEKPPAEAEYAVLQKQGDGFMVKGDYDLAVVYYTRSIEANGNNADAYYSRGLAYFNKDFYDLAVKDFSKGLELNPNEAIAYYYRGDAYERVNEMEKALTDYKKAVELNANNDRAKASIKRVQVEVDKIVLARAEQTRLEQERLERARAESQRIAQNNQSQQTPRVNANAENPPRNSENRTSTQTPPTTTNASSDLGTLTSENAVTMATPVYPPEARKYRVEGQVRVQVEIDAQGNVTSAKAVAGPGFLRGAAENAASKSKFKAGLATGRANGTIVYNFKL